MHDFKLTTPVALIIFNRPETTARVFAEIAKVKPPKLLVVGDGPRIDRAGESELVALTQAIIRNVDWPCEVLTNFSEVNLGCKNRVSSGIDWIFQQVEEVIILEDDCLPEISFFRFCQEMLELYREDKRVGVISGDNFQFGRRYGSDSYYFSKYVHIWGWASWRDRWQITYDVNMKKWPLARDNGLLATLMNNSREISYWKRIFNKVHLGKIDTWDYQWIFANWLLNRLTILPSVNLISNIGFDQNATHTKWQSELANLTTMPMNFPLIHPNGFFRNIDADNFSYRKCFRVPLWKRILSRVQVMLG